MHPAFLEAFKTSVVAFLFLSHQRQDHPRAASHLVKSSLAMAQDSATASTAADESSKNLSPWLDRWREKRIGFHLTEVNPTIVKYAERFLLPSSSRDGPSETCSNARVLVPLCGKTVDMAYLATATSASEVVGVEGIRLALEEFAEEHPALRVVVEAAGTAAMTADDAGGAFERFEGERITLLRGDYFELNAQEAGGKFGLIYDRASLVAIEPGLRTAYVDVQGELLEPGGRILLVVLERRGPEEAMKEGPPYSVPESAVRALYEGKDWVQSVEWLEQSDQLERKPEDKARYPDLDQLLETVYLIETKT